MALPQTGAIRVLVATAMTSALLGGGGVGAFVIRDDPFELDTPRFVINEHDLQPASKTANADVTAAWQSRRQRSEESGSGDDDSGSGDNPVPTATPTAAPTAAPTAVLTVTPSVSPSKAPTITGAVPEVELVFHSNFTALNTQALRDQFCEDAIDVVASRLETLTVNEVHIIRTSTTSNVQCRIREGSIIAVITLLQGTNVDMAAAETAAHDIVASPVTFTVGGTTYISVGAIASANTLAPTAAPTGVPTTRSPTGAPTKPPTAAPTRQPTMAPTGQLTLCADPALPAADTSTNFAQDAQQVALCWLTPSDLNAKWYRVVWVMNVSSSRQQAYNPSDPGAGNRGYGYVNRSSPPNQVTQYTVRNLLPDTGYTFYIIAEFELLDELDEQTPSNDQLVSIGQLADAATSVNGATADGYGSVIAIRAVTLSHDPSSGVAFRTAVTTTPATPSNITVQWEAPEYDVVQYRLRWNCTARRFPDQDMVSTIEETLEPARDICTGRLCTYAITGLDPASKYNITVELRNTQNPTEFKVPVSTERWTKSSSPSGSPSFSTVGGGNRCEVFSLSPTGAIVQWAAPSPANVNGMVVQYRLDVFFDVNGSKATTLTIGASTTPLETSDLEGQLMPSTSYRLMVAARTGYDASGGSCSNCWGPNSSCLFGTPDASPDPDAAGASADESGSSGGVVAVIFVIVLLAAAIAWVYWRTHEDLPLNPFEKNKAPPVAKRITGGHTLNTVQETKFGEGNGGVGSDRGLKIPPPPVLPPVQSHPVNVDDLANTVVQMSANSDFAFSEEYECLETGNEFSREAAQLYENKMKNRYANILAYDYTRVRLTLLPDDPYSDYINANYIDGYGESQKRKYIAAQGPTALTVIDFWRMLYETDSNVVIMVTNCEEKGRIKCHRYWPTALNEEMPLLENFSVVLEHVEEYPDFVIRKVRIKFEAVQRVMYQFHYTSWPDHGVPESTAGILMMLRKARAKKGAGPMVVHCSAGVGRTGTLIAIDHNIDRSDKVDNVDVFQCLNMMRRQRNTMVQTEEQYIFIYRALLDSLSSVNSEMTEAELRAHFSGLAVVGKDGMSLRDRDFKKLAGIAPNKDMRTDSAQLAANKPKNRFQNIMPFEHTRLKLTPLPGVMGSDYLNANLIDGHKQKGAYIATQGPLEETAADFWRMIWERNIDVVVMLSSLIENGREQSFQYWPDRADDGKMAIGDYQISLNMELDVDYGVERTFTVTELVSETSRNIKQCQFTSWPKADEDLTFGTPMVSLVRSIKMYQDSKVVTPNMTEDIYGNASAINEQEWRSQTKPIVVHCNAGVGRTGAFCAFHINLKKMEEDGKVDVFSTVKHLRTQRMSMVQTPDQYEHIYKMLIEVFDAGVEQFSDTNNLYANVHSQSVTLDDSLSKEEMKGFADTIDFEEAPPPLPTKRSAKLLERGSRSGSIVKYDEDGDGFAV